VKAGVFAVWDPAVSTVPAKIIPARRESCFHCGPRTRSAMAWSDCWAAAGVDKQRFERKMIDRQTVAPTNTYLGERIASLFLEGRNRERSWEWN